MSGEKHQRRLDFPHVAGSDHSSRPLGLLLWMFSVLPSGEAGPLADSQVRTSRFSQRDVARLVEEKLLTVRTVRGQPWYELTPLGESVCIEALRAMRKHLCDGPPAIPRWDPLKREFSYGGKLLKRFRRSAPNQERLLAAFEESGWPQRIDDPLPVDAEIVPAQRLHDTIKQLNRTLVEPLLHFHGDGTGRGVCWRPTRTARRIRKKTRISPNLP